MVVNNNNNMTELINCSVCGDDIPKINNTKDLCDECYFEVNHS